MSTSTMKRGAVARFVCMGWDGDQEVYCGMIGESDTRGGQIMMKARIGDELQPVLERREEPRRL